MKELVEEFKKSIKDLKITEDTISIVFKDDSTIKIDKNGVFEHTKKIKETNIWKILIILFITTPPKDRYVGFDRYGKGFLKSVSRVGDRLSPYE